MMQRGILPVMGATRRCVPAAGAPLRSAAPPVAPARTPLRRLAAPRAAPSLACQHASLLSALAHGRLGAPARNVRGCASAPSTSGGAPDTAGEAGDAQQHGTDAAAAVEYLVINFYHLVDIPDTKEVWPAAWGHGSGGACAPHSAACARRTGQHARAAWPRWALRRGCQGPRRRVGQRRAHTQPLAAWQRPRMAGAVSPRPLRPDGLHPLLLISCPPR